MNDDQKIMIILGFALLIACSVAWYCRDDEAKVWRDKYHSSEEAAKEAKKLADYRLSLCVRSKE